MPGRIWAVEDQAAKPLRSFPTEDAAVAWAALQGWEVQPYAGYWTLHELWTRDAVPSRAGWIRWDESL